MNALDAFVEAAARAVQTWPEGRAACADRLRDLAASDALGRRVADELEALAARPTHTPAGTASLHSWILWSSPSGARLTLLRVAAGEGDDAGYLTDSPSDQLLATLGEAVAGDLYEQGAPDPEVLAPDRALAPRGSREVRPGEVLALRARRDVFDIRPLPEPRYLLVFDGPRAFTQQWVYARATLAPVASVAADPHDARLEAGMRLLRVLGHAPGVPAIAALAAHPAHFVRWTAVRYAMALDPDEGFRLLEHAASDPHPHVRNAARRALGLPLD
jgi:hypothetical protein